MRECSGEAISAHDPEGGAIREAPVLIAPARVQQKGLLELQAGLGHDLEIGISPKALDQTDRAATQCLTAAATVIQELSETISLVTMRMLPRDWESRFALS
jgi:hypothetical protein